MHGSQQRFKFRAVTTSGGTKRQGEQLECPAITREPLASPPSQQFRPDQDPWKKALEDELGAVLESSAFHRATVHPSRCPGSVAHEPVSAVNRTDQASSSPRSQEPRRSGRTGCVVCSVRAGNKCSGCRRRVCSGNCLRVHYRRQECSIRWTEWQSLTGSQRQQVGWETFRSVWCAAIMHGRGG